MRPPSGGIADDARQAADDPASSRVRRLPLYYRRATASPFEGWFPRMVRVLVAVLVLSRSEEQFEDDDEDDDENDWLRLRLYFKLYFVISTVSPGASMPKISSTSAFSMRMQPSDMSLPMVAGSVVPWMPRP